MGMVASSVYSSPSSSKTSVAALTTAADKPHKSKVSKRLFIAVELPDDAKQLCLETTTGKLLPLDKSEDADTTSMKWVIDPSLFHCTLQFLGSVETDRIEDLTDQLRRQIQSIAPFTLQLGGFGVLSKPQEYPKC